LPHGLPFYDNVALWAVRHRLIGVNMTYRLAPQFGWPAGAEDVASAVRYLRGAIASRNGDPERIYVMGHSAGAVHVATYLAHPEMQSSDGPGIAGAVLGTAMAGCEGGAEGEKEENVDEGVGDPTLATEHAPDPGLRMAAADREQGRAENRGHRGEEPALLEGRGHTAKMD